MRILVVGAGAVGGYFGARLVAGGADVTFSVRSGTEAVLRESGLRVLSPLGDLHLQEPRLLDSESDAPFDLVLICTKLRDLEAGIDIAEAHLADDGLAAALQNGVESEAGPGSCRLHRGSLGAAGRGAAHRGDGTPGDRAAWRWQSYR